MDDQLPRLIREDEIAVANNDVRQAGSVSTEASRKRKHGGSRKVLTWQEKLSLCESDVVEEFLASASCKCGKNCFLKLAAVAHDSVKIICALRSSKTAGNNPNPNPKCTQPHLHKTASRRINCH